MGRIKLSTSETQTITIPGLHTSMQTSALGLLSVLPLEQGRNFMFWATYSSGKGTMNTHFNSTSTALAVIADKLALVYDTEGKILHVHRVTTLQGRKPRSNDELVRAAHQHA